MFNGARMNSLQEDLGSRDAFDFQDWNQAWSSRDESNAGHNHHFRPENRPECKHSFIKIVARGSISACMVSQSRNGLVWNLHLHVMAHHAAKLCFSTHGSGHWMGSLVLSSHIRDRRYLHGLPARATCYRYFVQCDKPVSMCYPPLSDKTHTRKGKTSFVTS
jgi:hypothetical protein